LRYSFGPPASGDDFASVVARTSDLRSLTRSTVPLLGWWRDHAEQQLLHADEVGSATAHFEYAVPARCKECGGKGKDSFTDVMVLASARAIAIEAKYTETRYESVARWLERSDSSANRERVLSHWCHLIEEKTGDRVPRADLGGLVYQLVHRTASACAAAKGARCAEVRYLLFEQQDARNHARCEQDLAEAARVLDTGGRIAFSVHHVPTRDGRDYADILRALQECPEEERSALVAEALLAGKQLHRFDATRIVRLDVR
jgi:hypothetical protein